MFKSQSTVCWLEASISSSIKQRECYLLHEVEVRLKWADKWKAVSTKPATWLVFNKMWLLYYFTWFPDTHCCPDRFQEKREGRYENGPSEFSSQMCRPTVLEDDLFSSPDTPTLLLLLVILYVQCLIREMNFPVSSSWPCPIGTMCRMSLCPFAPAGNWMNSTKKQAKNPNAPSAQYFNIQWLFPVSKVWFWLSLLFFFFLFKISLWWKRMWRSSISGFAFPTLPALSCFLSILFSSLGVLMIFTSSVTCKCFHQTCTPA